MPSGKVRIEGLRELRTAIAELPKATGKNVVKRAMINALTPMANQAAGLAPALTGELRRSVQVSAKLSGRQASEHRAEFGSKTVLTPEGWRSNPQTEIFMFMGPGPGTKSIVQEFGSVHQAPKPYMRPAWDSGVMPALETIKDELWSEIEKAAARVASKAARAA